MRYCPTTAEVLAIHNYLIEEFGGKAGLRDMGSLESALGRLKTGYYSDLIEEAAALMESLSQNHPFSDGNKRISFFITDTFLRMNGYFIDCDDEETFSFFQSLFDTSTFDYDHLKDWLREKVQKLP
jgi:death-on-curing protein